MTIHESQERFLSALADLKQKALARRSQMNTEQLKASIGWLSALGLGGYAISEGIGMLRRPACFGDFYYKTRNRTHRHGCRWRGVRSDIW